jgi:hypothetical protein
MFKNKFQFKTKIMQAGIVFIALLATIFGIVYLFFTTRHKERLTLIEKGADASLFNTGKETVKKQVSWAKFSLKIGMLFIGFAIGIISASVLADSNVLNPGAAYPSMILLFGGVSLVLFYLIDRKGNSPS